MQKLECELSIKMLAFQPQFIHHDILSNFFFHISMAYAIAKVQGEPVSNADFAGYHAYPPGFSFIQSS